MASISALEEQPSIPLARRDDSIIDNYHGTPVPDPYRWLEDPDADEVKEFVEKQVNLTQSLLQTCETREKLRSQITALFDHPRFEIPFKKGGKYFYFHNTGLQAQSVLYVQNDLEGEAEVLLDPNSLSEDGTVALSISSVSEDAKFLGYGLSTSGSDWVTIKVMRVEDKNVEPDSLSWRAESDLSGILGASFSLALEAEYRISTFFLCLVKQRTESLRVAVLCNNRILDDSQVLMFGATCCIGRVQWGSGKASRPWTLKDLVEEVQDIAK